MFLFNYLFSCLFVCLFIYLLVDFALKGPTGSPGVPGERGNNGAQVRY